MRTQYLHLGVFLWKQYVVLASFKDLCKLQSFFTYSFTHTNIVFLFKYLPTGNVIFINVYYQIKCFSGDSFSFLVATLYAPEISLFKVFMNACKLTGEMPIDRSFFLSI